MAFSSISLSFFIYTIIRDVPFQCHDAINTNYWWEGRRGCWLGDDGVWECWRQSQKTLHSFFAYFHKFLHLSHQLAYIMENCKISFALTAIPARHRKEESRWAYMTGMQMLAQQSESRQTELNLRGCEETHGDMQNSFMCDWVWDVNQHRMHQATVVIAKRGALS